MTWGPTVSSRRRLLVVLLGAAALGWAVAGPASAHNVLESTVPADHATVTRTPPAVVLTFAEPAIELGTEVVVTGPAGAAHRGTPKLFDHTVSQELQPGSPAGLYTVAWRATSVDGHPISGAFTFTATAADTGRPASPGPAAPAPAARPPSFLPAWPWPVNLAIGLIALLVAWRVGRRGRHRR